MQPLTILHLSDLHWSPSNRQDLAIVTQALFEDIDRLRTENDIYPDIIVFSGDLAQGADSLDWLQGAYDEFLIPLSKHTSVPMDRIFVAPGNHDIARETVRRIPSIEKNLRDSLQSTSAINHFLDLKSEDGDEKHLALKRVSNFYDAHDCYHPAPISKNDLLRTFRFEVRGCDVGVACLNSAWRATGESDNADWGKLIIGERILDQALSDLEGAEFKIAVHHHPLDWLCAADRDTSDFLTRRSFSLSCCGHVHSARPSFSQDATGACITSQAGSVFDKRDWFNGYQFIQIDLPSRDYKFTVRQYINSQRRFDAATTVCDGGSMIIKNVQTGDPRRVDLYELFMRPYRDQLREAVREHLNISGEDESTAQRWISNFVAPPITKRLRASLEKESDVAAEDIDKVFKPNDLIDLNEHVLVLGDRQTGRTGLAYFIAHELGTRHYDNPYVPVYVDLREFNFNKYGLRRAITNFYGPPPTGFSIDRAIAEGMFAFIVDNLAHDEADLVRFAKLVTSFPNNRWIAFGTPNSDGVSPDRSFNEHLPDFHKFHVRELTRGGIRAISKNWCGPDSNGAAKEAYDAVINQLVRDGLPRTPYMVSLLLWALQQKKSYQKLNESVLLGNIVDHLIGKADFRLAKQGQLNPVGKEITLQNLAYHLKDKGGIASENDVTQFLIEFFHRKKLPFIGGDVLDKLVSCGVLKRDGDSIGFKYDCFQEYFFAGLLKNDPKLLSHYLTDLNFLEVRREIELLAGIRQQNDDLIDAIENVLDSRVPNKFLEMPTSNFDAIAHNELRLGTTKAQLGKIRRSRLTDDQVDEMMDEADRRAMERGEGPVSESINRAEGNVVSAAKEREAANISRDREMANQPLRPSTHMAAIDTLARVIRNSDFTDYDKKGPATAKVLSSWVKIYLLILSEVRELLGSIGKKEDDPIGIDELDTIMYIMSKFLFNGVSEGLIAHISSPAMSDTIKELLNEGNLNSGEFLLGLFLLEDMNDDSWKDRWSEVISDRSRSGFVIDCFIERLLMISHTKALDTDQSARVGSLVNEIETRFGWTNEKKNSVLEHIKQAVPLTAIREARG